jgi:threonine synthase
MPWSGVIQAYRPFIDVANVEPVTLLEGDTPLIPAPRLASALGLPYCDLRVKYEGLNPTGSFKDRGMTAAMTQALADGARSVICASTGNTPLRQPPAARAGLKCVVLIPQAKSPPEIGGAIVYGAQVISIQGSFDDGLRLVREISTNGQIMLVNSINPYRLQGQKTAAFEICDELGDAPDWLCLPVGNAGNITAYWMGFTQYHASGKAQHLPRLLGVQAAGAAPLVLGYPIENPETIATAIRITARGEEALIAAQESKGCILSVTDDEISAAWKMLVEIEGIWVEPASAAGVAGLRKAAQQNPHAYSNKTIVCAPTGHGLKDPTRSWSARLLHWKSQRNWARYKKRLSANEQEVTSKTPCYLLRITRCSLLVTHYAIIIPYSAFPVPYSCARHHRQPRPRLRLPGHGVVAIQRNRSIAARRAT